MDSTVVDGLCLKDILWTIGDLDAFYLGHLLLLASRRTSEIHQNAVGSERAHIGLQHVIFNRHRRQGGSLYFNSRLMLWSRRSSQGEARITVSWGARSAHQWPQEYSGILRQRSFFGVVLTNIQRLNYQNIPRWSSCNVPMKHYRRKEVWKSYNQNILSTAMLQIHGPFSVQPYPSFYPSSRTGLYSQKLLKTITATMSLLQKLSKVPLALPLPKFGTCVSLRRTQYLYTTENCVQTICYMNPPLETLS